jgi:hypothetical protein
MRLLLVVAFAATLCSGVAQAAGAYDGQWSGAWGGGSSTGGVGGERGCQGFNGTVEMTVADGHVSGLSKGRAEAKINGTVAQDGKFTGRLGSFDITGQFSGKHFQGNWTSGKCVFNVTADKG